MPRIAHLGGLLSLAAACAPPGSVTTPAAPTATTSAEIRSLADEYVQEFFREFPDAATLDGYPSADHSRLTDNSLDAVRRWHEREDVWLARLRAIDARGLVGTSEGRTYDALREYLEGRSGQRVCRFELWPVSPTFTGWQGIYPFVASIQPVGTPELRTAAIARFRSFPGYLDTEVANMRIGLSQGYIAPRTAIESVVAQLNALLAGDPAGSPFVSPAVRDTAAPPSFRTELTRVTAAEINPAIRRYRDFLANEYLPRARSTWSVADTPGGEACYRASIRANTTLPIEPREIHEIGLQQMAQIRSEMEQISRRLFGNTDVRAALERLRTDTAFTFRGRQEMIDYAQAAIDRAHAALPRWFGIIPRAPVVVVPYPEFQERAAPGGQYNPPSEDGTRPGIYLINTYNPRGQSRAGLESTAFHETYPGHHLQIAIARERPSAHEFIRYFGTSGFIEGWGLYSERLAEEMGLFSGDVDRMGLLSNEALRAARLVTDAGIHALGWSRQQAIDYMLENTAEPREHAASEIDRYIAVPGQATAYMLGNLEIRRLRQQAQRELDDRFDVREFHDRVLEDGNVTLPMLRTKIERWIAASK